LSLNKLVLQVTISKMYKTNIKTLRIAILNKFRTQHFNVKTIKLTRNIYIFALYYLRLCYIFLTLAKINLVNNLQLIEKKLWIKNWLNTKIKNKMYKYIFVVIVVTRVKLRIITKTLYKKQKRSRYIFDLCSFFNRYMCS
jgi:hypothetical protein